MADYYPLLARAVTGLQNSTLEARQSIYDRARDALLGQLRSIAPALAEQDIERESEALDAAVKRLEDELAVEAARRRRAEKKVEARTEADAATEEADQTGSLTTTGEHQTDEARKARDNGTDDASSAHDRRTRPERRRIEPMHPAAPTPQIPRQNKARIWIVGATIVVIVAMIGVTAYVLRDPPEDLAHTRPADPVIVPVTSVGKIVGRIGNEGPAAATSPVPAVKVVVVPVEPPAPTAPSKSSPASKGPIAPAKGPSLVGPSQSPTVPVPSVPVPTLPATTPAIPVAYRSALLIQNEKNSEGHKTFVGTVIWRLDSVTADPGQPLQTAWRADVDIPDAKLKVSMQMQKNNDPALSASHTMVIGFASQPDSLVKGVTTIEMPRMRDEASANGDAFIGIGIVPITPTYFLVGLQQGAQNIARNFDLLKSRGWIDVQFELADGRAAKITFEKGLQGQEYLKDAMAAWK